MSGIPVRVSVVTFHSCAMLSSSTVARVLPSGLNVTDWKGLSALAVRATPIRRRVAISQSHSGPP